MATAAQIRANRENAQRSTGPRSEAGKQAIRYNALKHGLAAESLVIRGEDPSALDEVRAQLQADYLPVGEIEAMLVDEIAQCWWRLRRARAQETRSIYASMLGLQPFNPDDVGPILRYISSAERAWHRAINQLRALQNDRRQRELASEAEASSSQPEETERVMAVGSVPQTGSESVQTDPSAGFAARPQAPQPCVRLDIPAIMRQLEVDIQNTEEEIRREQGQSAASEKHT